MVSAVLELIEPATDVAPLWAVAGCVLIGAAAFVGLDRTVKTKLGSTFSSPEFPNPRWD